MYSLIAFATNWGTKFGGINSFNVDFLKAFGFAYHLKAQIICIVSSCTPEEEEEAAKAHVALVLLPYVPTEKTFGPDQAQAGLDQLKHRNISFDPNKTIWLGHDRITGAAANAASRLAGGRSALIHHMSYDHYESYAEDSKTAYDKTQDQTALFRQADIVLAVGPLLRDALEDRLDASKNVHMLIPGLAEIEPRRAPNTFTAFLSGRLTDDAARIKQGHLGIAAFAKAHSEARKSDIPESLSRQPKLMLRGVNFESISLPGAGADSPETELKKFAEEFADCVFNIQALPYTQDRKTLYSDLSSASVALMPSWHEGFGLVAWEAIAAGVPLVISRNSGVYRLLDEKHPGAGPGCVYVIDVRGAVSSPFFHTNDLQGVVNALQNIANKPDEARKKASILRDMLGSHTWPACAEEAMNAFGWSLQKGSLPSSIPERGEPEPIVTDNALSTPDSPTDLPLHMPGRLWKAGIGMADSQLLRAEEARVPFDPARQPEIDTLIAWIDDPQWPQAVRLLTGGGGLGKTRLALEVCHQRLQMGWQAGFLDNDLDAKNMTPSWLALKNINKPLLVVIDYAETRQGQLMALIKAVLKNPGNQPLRLLLLARDGGEWWDNLPSKDRECEPLLSGYATSGPYRLPALYTAEKERHEAYGRALQSFANALGVSPPDLNPEMTGEHFERPLYIQMAALLAFYGEQPTTAEGLTKSLLNHERRYWRGVLSHLNWTEPERYAQQLLALTTLAGGFPTPKAAFDLWINATGMTLKTAEFNNLFYSLVTLYPGKQGLQAVRPDLLGEALVAQSLLRVGADTLLDAVLSKNSSQHIRRNALTIIARLSKQRKDLHQILAEALARHFPSCCIDILKVGKETTGYLPELAVHAFVKLIPAIKSQVSGMLEPFRMEESVVFNELYFKISEFVVQKLKDRSNKVEEYAKALGNHSIQLQRTGRNEMALSCAFEVVELFKKLKIIHKHLEPDYARSLNNYAKFLSEAGKNEEALERAGAALEIRHRLARKNPDQFETDYAMALNNYANRLGEAGKNDVAFEKAEAALEIYQRLARKNPDRFEPDYAMLSNNYAIRLSDAGKNEEALEKAGAALEIRQRLVRKNPDRFESDYAMSLNNYASDLSDAGKNEEALEHAGAALEIYQRLARKNPDRFEPDYAMSLNNYAKFWSDAGENEEALEQAGAALEIRQRLALKNPAKFAEDFFSTTCNVNFLYWLSDHPLIDQKMADLSLLSSVPSHERKLMQLYHAFVQACRAPDSTTRIDAFKQVLSYWEELSPAQKNNAQEYWLCAAAWCAKFTPETLKGSVWREKFYQYSKQRDSRLPHWMREVAIRLEFEWPAVMK